MTEKADWITDAIATVLADVWSTARRLAGESGTIAISGVIVCALSRYFPDGFILRDLGVIEAIAIVLALRVVLPVQVENFAALTRCRFRKF